MMPVTNFQTMTMPIKAAMRSRTVLMVPDNFYLFSLMRFAAQFSDGTVCTITR